MAGKKAFLSTKAIAIGFNVLLLGFGITLTLLGFLATNYGELNYYITTPAISITSIVLGITMFVISIIGFCGAFNEKKIVLIIYSVILFAILMTMIFLVVESVYERNNAKYWIKDAWEKMNNKHKKEIEEKYICCGFYIPDNSTFCQRMKIHHPDIAGCYKTLEHFMQRKIIVIEITSIIMGAVIFVGMIVSTSLLVSIHLKDKNEDKSLRSPHKEKYVPISGGDILPPEPIKFTTKILI